MYKGIDGLEKAFDSFERVEKVTEIILLGKNGGIRRILIEDV